MRENVGHTDRIVRSILGPGLFAVGLHQLLGSRWLGLLGVVAGTLVTETAVTRVCPLNTALGIDTRSTMEKTQDFRADVNEQSDRIAAEYAEPIAIDEVTAPA
jgi:hypothetical protein